MVEPTNQNSGDSGIDFSDFISQHRSLSPIPQKDLRPRAVGKGVTVAAIAAAIIIPLLIYWLYGIAQNSNTKPQYPDFVPPQSEGGI